MCLRRERSEKDRDNGEREKARHTHTHWENNTRKKGDDFRDVQLNVVLHIKFESREIEISNSQLWKLNKGNLLRWRVITSETGTI